MWRDVEETQVEQQPPPRVGGGPRAGTGAGSWRGHGSDTGSVCALQMSSLADCPIYKQIINSL